MTVKRHTFTVPDLMLMAEAGMFPEQRVELIDGEIYDMTPPNPPHAGLVDRLTEAFVLAFAGRARVSVQNPVRLTATWLPQPDVALLRPGEYLDHHPTPADVLLLVEVSHTTLAFDRGRKLPKYAEVGIPEVWIVDVERQRTHLHRRPAGDAYEDVIEVGFDEAFTVQAFPDSGRAWLAPPSSAPLDPRAT